MALRQFPQLEKQKRGASLRLAFFVVAAIAAAQAWYYPFSDADAAAQSGSPSIRAASQSAGANSIKAVETAAGRGGIAGGPALQVSVTVKVTGSRLVIADASGNIKSIYSNTPDSDAPVLIRLGSPSGPMPQNAAAVLERYQRLQSQIDWGRFGLVYSRP
ncbi:MAG: hypothetical protein FJ320_06505 [SAR202 cluster bacterium]|nr:hypothetical protein [SAR202 cluster bacterium]